MRSRPLTHKQRLFLEHYLEHGVALEAYRHAYNCTNMKSDSALRMRAAEVLHKPAVQAALVEHQEARLRRLELSVDRVDQEVAKLAFFDPRRMLDDQGVPLPLSELDDIEAAAIESFEVEVLKDDEGNAVGRLAKVKMLPRTKALDMLYKRFGQYITRHHHTASEALTDAILARRAEVAGITVEGHGERSD